MSVMVPMTAGAVMLTGASGRTTGVSAEACVPVPPALVAVTTTRTVCPASPAVSVRVTAVAPGMSAQPVPAAVQSCHW